LNNTDQFGGQSIACFDYGMAEGVRKSFKKDFKKNLKAALKYTNYDNDKVLEIAENNYPTYLNNECLKELSKKLSDKFNVIEEIIYDFLNKVYENTCEQIEDETYQAMESVIFNLNSMHSRCGSQTPFSSLNFGTDTSPEGRLVTEKLLLSQEEGLGKGETPIFPITVFKMKEGINYNPGDPNYDLFKLAIRVSAKRLFPNFVNVDAPYNLQYYKPDDPRTEIATMGCRTRTISNVNGPEIVTSRGNFSFTTINLPKLAIESQKNIKEFYKLLDKYMELAKNQILWRYHLIGKRHVYNYPFLLGQGVWMDSEKLKPNDTIEKILKHASLSIGFCGLAECLKFLTGKHHGESEESQKLGLEIIGHMREMTDKYIKDTHLNWSVFATPAESTAGSFQRSNQAHYGIIKGVTDKEYMTNSSHVPVYYPIKAIDKIRIEAPYHALCNAGAIMYVEMDGDPTKNLSAFEKIVRTMHDYDCTYCAINHPIDRCSNCGYNGIIDNECPVCGQKDHINNQHVKMPCIC